MDGEIVGSNVGSYDGFDVDSYDGSYDGSGVGCMEGEVGGSNEGTGLRCIEVEVVGSCDGFDVSLIGDGIISPTEFAVGRMEGAIASDWIEVGSALCLAVGGA